MGMFNTGPSNQFRTQGGYSPQMGMSGMNQGMGMNDGMSGQAMGAPQDMYSSGGIPNMQAGGAGPNPDQLQMLLKLLQGSQSSMQPMSSGFKPMNMNPAGIQGVGGGFTGGGNFGGYGG